MKTIAIISLFLSLFIISCQTPADRGSDEEIGSATYNIKIDRTGDGKSQEFKGVKAKWSPSVLTIHLGSEDQNLGPNESGGSWATLLIIIQGELIFISDTDEPKPLYVDSAILVTGDVVVGTAEEINAKTYMLTNRQKLNVLALNDEYIKADSTKFKMERAIINQNDVPEDIEITVSFTALDKLTPAP